MKERPILFSGPMVQAILDGKKTQTRRPLRPQPTKTDFSPLSHFDGTVGAMFGDGEVQGGRQVEQYYCPFGKRGDRLWVRETWAPCSTFDPSEDTGAIHRAGPWRNGVEPSDVKWRPSIHMPRWASRITLEITNIRIERLHEITMEDVLAEGFSPEQLEVLMPDRTWQKCQTYLHPLDVMRDLWDTLNAKRGYGWRTNPWVWVVEFQKAVGR